MGGMGGHEQRGDESRSRREPAIVARSEPMAGRRSRRDIDARDDDY